MKAGIPNDKLTITIIQNAVIGAHLLVHLAVTATERENVKGTDREKAGGVLIPLTMRVHVVEKAGDVPSALNPTMALGEEKAVDVP